MNSDNFFKALEETLRDRKSFPEALDKMVYWCANNMPHKDWERIKRIDVSDDYKKGVQWIPDVLKKYPCPFEIKALYFGLAEMSNSKGEEYADLYVGFMGQFDAADKESNWVFGEKKHYPDKAGLKTKTLKTAGLIFNRENGLGLGNDGNFAFSLSYALLLVTSILTPELYAILNTNEETIGVLAGWDSGDLLRPGLLTKNGFIPSVDAMI